MKAKFLATSVSLALLGAAGQAAAVDVTISGASAAIATVARFMSQVCTAAPTNVGFDSNHRLLSCTLINAAPVPVGIRGQQLNLSYTAAVNNLLGGSLLGITPITRTLPVPIQFVTAANPACTAATCPSSIPDMGVSDTNKELHSNPENFADPAVALNAALPAIDNACKLALWKSNPLAATNPAACGGGAGLAPHTSKLLFNEIFGFAVTNTVRGLGITSLSLSELKSIYSGSVDDWSMLRNVASHPIKICRRTQGSGTQATINVLINGVPGTNPLAVQAGGVGLGPNGTLTVVENATTGDLRTCLANAQTAGEFAIGHLSLENNTQGIAGGWQFVDVEGAKIWDNTGLDVVDGDNDNVLEQNVINGSYSIYSEAYLHYKNTLAGQKLDVANMLDGSAGPTITDGTPGVVSLQKYYPGATTPIPTPLNGRITPYTRDGDMRNPSHYKAF